MYITITSIQLKSRWHFFSLSWQALQIVRQLKQQEGFIQMKKKGWGRWHYTITTWKSLEQMRKFAQEKAHLKAMKKTSKIASIVETYSYVSDQLPPWEEAIMLLKKQEKKLSFPSNSNI